MVFNTLGFWWGRVVAVPQCIEIVFNGRNSIVILYATYHRVHALHIILYMYV